jgi:hypothetical protein
MESAISIFRKLPETKEQVKMYSGLIKAAVLNGEVEPLLFWQQITALEKLIEDVKKDMLVRDVVLEEAEKYGKSFAKHSAKFQIKEAGVRYDFDRCGDQEWYSLNNQIQDLTDKRKRREEFLKAIQPGSEVFGSDGVQIMPAGKQSTTTVVITLND